jgi:hypothetical protein
MSSQTLEWVRAIGSLLLSWPVVILVIALIFRKRLLNVFDRFIGSDEGSKIEVASVKIELGRLAREGKDAVTNLNRLTVLMAESRLLELEITSRTFGAAFSNEQRERMNQQIDELRRLTSSEVAVERHNDGKQNDSG